MKCNETERLGGVHARSFVRFGLQQERAGLVQGRVAGAVDNGYVNTSRPEADSRVNQRRMREKNKRAPRVGNWTPSVTIFRIRSTPRTAPARSPGIWCTSGAWGTAALRRRRTKHTCTPPDLCIARTFPRFCQTPLSPRSRACARCRGSPRGPSPSFAGTVRSPAASPWCSSPSSAAPPAGRGRGGGNEMTGYPSRVIILASRSPRRDFAFARRLETVVWRVGELSFARQKPRERSGRPLAKARMYRAGKVIQSVATTTGISLTAGFANGALAKQVRLRNPRAPCEITAGQRRFSAIFEKITARRVSAPS